METEVTGLGFHKKTYSYIRLTKQKHRKDYTRNLSIKQILK